ncbi:MAG: hypothetical protein HKN78_13125 [Sphingomonadaceae bacterium]|nr:hypothetical protein [Sphingomonadaceae bacterium]
MNLNALCTRFILVVFGVALWAVSSPAKSQAQTIICYDRLITTLNFNNGSYVTGTGTGPLTVNAQYRFSNVNTGIDALVRINAFNNGATLATIDNNAVLPNNFNPELGGSNARSVDFTFTFVIAGTSTPIGFDFAAGAIDIDGDNANIREYAEFSNALAEFILNNPTRLVVTAPSPASPTRTRFEAGTSNVAPGIDPNEARNIVAVFYTGQSSFQYRIGTLGTGTTTRLTSLDFNCPTFGNPAPNPSIPQDFGDAPATYGNPIHDIVAGFRLGVTNTSESGPYNHAGANADAGDDGVVFGALGRGSPSSLTATVLGSGGRLQAWIDWNRDSDFLDAGERVALNVQDNQAGDSDPVVGRIRIDFNVPGAASLGNSFARVRWSTQANLPADTQTAPDGEVEDYRVTILLGLAELEVEKSSAVFDPNGDGLFHIPGNDVTYTITVRNTGTDEADNDSIFVYDTLPLDVEFFNGDTNGPAAAGTGTILFTETGTGLAFDETTDAAYSNLAGPPANFAACTYSPVAGYDPNVRHVCVRPQGSMAADDPDPEFTLQFRARIR